MEKLPKILNIPKRLSLEKQGKTTQEKMRNKIIAQFSKSYLALHMQSISAAISNDNAKAKLL